MTMYCYRYQDMTETFKEVSFVPGGATLNAIKVAQVSAVHIYLLWLHFSHLPIVVAFLTFTYCGCISHIYLLWLHFSLYTISVTYIIVNIFCFIWLEAVNQLLKYVFAKIDVACQYNSTIIV